jgi:hypothetical protein
MLTSNAAGLMYGVRRAAAMEATMDWNRVEGNWNQLKGKIKQKWGSLTDDDISKIEGRRD